jgi:hypothetical protein
VVVSLGDSYFELLSRIVPCVHRILVLAWIAVQLPAIDFDRRQVETTVGQFLVGAVLPLHDSLGASGRLCCVGVSSATNSDVQARVDGTVDVRFAIAR